VALRGGRWPFLLVKLTTQRWNLPAVDVKHDQSALVRISGAPALEKGLDVLEALAEERDGLSQKAVAQRVGRSVGEVFRMLGVLERRGYIVRSAATGMYSLTLRMFELANRHPPTRRLQSIALPVMEELARAIRSSCHLVVSSGDRMLVIAKADPDLPMGWTVRLGAVFPLSEHYVSARILVAFQAPARREAMIAIMARQERAAPEQEIAGRLDGIARVGHDVFHSELTAGVVDISYPVLDPLGQAVAALTVPYLPQAGITPERATVMGPHALAARRISEGIGGQQIP